MIYDLSITEGHDSGACFWIAPIKDDADDILGDDEISICEDTVFCLLYGFLLKFYDKQESEFEWYLEHNLYEFSTIQEMIAEIRKVIELLRLDYHNPYLRKYIKDYGIFYMTDSKSPLLDTTWSSTNDILIQDNINSVIIFYLRFIKLLERMMKKRKLQGYHLISFMGP